MHPTILFAFELLMGMKFCQEDSLPTPNTLACGQLKSTVREAPFANRFANELLCIGQYRPARQHKISRTKEKAPGVYIISPGPKFGLFCSQFLLAGVRGSRTHLPRSSRGITDLKSAGATGPRPLPRSCLPASWPIQRLSSSSMLPWGLRR